MRNPNFEKGFRSDINGLRALAVALVVFYHFGFSGVRGGFIGVDVFFVISGYLMTSILSNLVDNPLFVWQFYISRLRRIVPAMLVMIISVVLACWWLLGPNEYKKLAMHARDSLLFISNYIYAREAGYFDTGSHTKWFLHTWSLSLEFQFYLLIPLLFLVFKKFGIDQRRQLLIFMILAGVLFINCGIGTPENQTMYFYSLVTRAWELLVGGIVFFIAAELPQSIRIQKLIEYLGLTVVIGSGVMFSQDLVWPGWFAALPVVGTAMVLFASCSGSIWSDNTVSQWIGFRSYSIYLWHWPVVVYLSISDYMSNFKAVLAGLVVSVMLGCVSYSFVEEPVRKICKRPFLALVMIVCVWVCIGLGGSSAIIATDGVYNRFGNDIYALRSLEDASHDWSFPLSRTNQLVSASVDPTEDSAFVTVVLGDSHAEQWYPRVISLAQRPAQVQFITRGGCLPIPGYERFDNKGQCADFASDAWDRLIEVPPRRLLISAAWLLYAGNAKGQSNAVSCIKSGNICNRIDSDADLDSLFSPLEAKIRQANKLGIKVVILGPTPFSNYSYVEEKAHEITSQHLFFSQQRSRDFPGMASGFIDENTFRAGANPIVDRLKVLAESSGAEYIDTVSLICSAGKCPLVDHDGTPLYKDASHLRPGVVKSGRMAWFDSVLFGTKN